VPTHGDYPWERDARAQGEPSPVDGRTAEGAGGRGSPPLRPTGVGLVNPGGRRPRRTVRGDPGVFLRSPRQRAVAWGVLMVLLLHHVRLVW
jgi:hypothetical protein